jgi:WS/DGAT/MGAT family acyltransferase
VIEADLDSGRTTTSTTIIPLSVRRELALGITVFALYSGVAAMPVPGRRASAAAHGRSLFRLEQALHIDVERSLNGWLAAHPVIRVLVNYEYAITYVLSALLLLVWLFRRHPARYRVARNSFVLINLVGAGCFAIYPVMPPRLSEFGFVDTVRMGHTWGSWGTPMVDHADQLAAMPSLHVAWALWVSVELARLSARRSVQIVSACHIAITVFVIIATANHYVLDAVGAVILVAVCVPVAERITPARHGPRVKPADAFFLAVESPASPQHVGGVIHLDTTRTKVTRQALIDAVCDHMAELPRFRQRLTPGGWVRRPAWEDHPELDWDWHVVVRDVGGARLEALVAELQSAPLPRDRPLWRLILVPDIAAGRTAVIFLMHHVVADGIGVIAHALGLMEPTLPPAQNGRRPGRLRTAAGTVIGIAQLAAEGRQELRLSAAEPASAADSGERRFGMFRLPLRTVRDTARRHHARVSDVLLCSVAGGLSRIGAIPDARGRLRVTVPLMMRQPTTAPEGNYTAAVMVDLPYGPMPESERLALIVRSTARLYTGTRALGSWFVMQRVAGLLPASLHAAFARAVYGGRFFQAVASNLPGLDSEVRLAGAPLLYVHPILPSAPGAPLAIGAIGWRGQLNYGISAEPVLVNDAKRLSMAMRDVLHELAQDGQPVPEQAPEQEEAIAGEEPTATA